MIGIKQRVVSSAFGPAALDLMTWTSAFGSAGKNPEAACRIANDMIADRLVTRICRAGESFVDVGAHIGSIIVRVHKHDPSVRILAVEAEPAKAKNLRTVYPYAEVFDVAVGESAGEVELSIDTARSGYNSIVAGKGKADRTVRVRLAPLDSLIPDRQVDVLKVDVEGAELGVFIGGAGVIDRSRPTIMFESVGEATNALGYSPRKIWEWMQAHGYQVFTPDRVAHNARPMGLDTFLDCHQYPFRTHNYFAIHQDRRIEIRDRARQILGIG